MAGLATQLTLDAQNFMSQGRAGLDSNPHFCNVAPYMAPQPMGKPLRYVTRSGTDVLVALCAQWGDG